MGFQGPSCSIVCRLVILAAALFFRYRVEKQTHRQTAVKRKPCLRNCSRRG